MSTAVIQKSAVALPEGAVAVREGGLLAGVRRPCRDHGCDCGCVGRMTDGRLVFWCASAGHHFTAR